MTHKRPKPFSLFSLLPPFLSLTCIYMYIQRYSAFQAPIRTVSSLLASLAKSPRREREREGPENSLCKTQFDTCVCVRAQRSFLSYTSRGKIITIIHKKIKLTIDNQSFCVEKKKKSSEKLSTWSLSFELVWCFDLIILFLHTALLAGSRVHIPFLIIPVFYLA